MIDGRAGLGQFDDARVLDPKVRELAAKISYVVDPNNEYPRNFTGHIRATLKNGSVREVRRPHMRGGAYEPLSAAEIHDKFVDNALYGGFDKVRAEALAAWLDAIARGAAVDLGVARS